MENECHGDTKCNWYTWNNPQKIGTGTRRLRNKRTSGDHPDYRIVEISQNTEKSPVDLRRLAVTQTPMRKHQLTLPWKTLKSKIIYIIKLIACLCICVCVCTSIGWRGIEDT